MGRVLRGLAIFTRLPKRTIKQRILLSVDMLLLVVFSVLVGTVVDYAVPLGV